MGIFEAGMLICFGAAWPTNIINAYRAGTAKGQSLTFLVVLALGYIFGIIYKMETDMDIVFCLYILNFVMILANVLILLHNRKLDLEKETNNKLYSNKKSRLYS